MPLSLDQFAQQIVDSGVLSADEFAAARRTSSAADAEQFARELVKQKRLTAFQAQQIYSGRGKGLVLGNYVVLDKLGQGGMGMVLKARHRRMDRLVALKVLSPSVVKTPDLLARFHREVKAAARLEHPNIVIAHDADEARGTHFFVMQYVEGSDLASVVKKKGPLPVEQAIHCILQAARGLEYAHKHGVIHRDIKPANLLLDSHGTVKILDMGLARIEGETGSQAELTSTGAVMGTVDYMAPEQALNTKSADARSDIYSLGITLWYLLAGRPAYEGDSLMARLLAHREEEIPSLKRIRGEIPAALEALFRKMVAKSPNDRFQKMGEVISALEMCRESPAGTSSSPPSMLRGSSEETKLGEFLGLFGGDPSTPTLTAPKAKTAVSGDPASPGPEYEATVTAAEAEEGTDPGTLTNLTRSQRIRKSRTGPAARPRHRKLIAATAGGLGLIIAAFLFLTSSVRKDDSPAFVGPQPASSNLAGQDLAPPRTEVASVPGGRSGKETPVASAAAPALQAGALTGLEFDGLDDYVDIPGLAIPPRSIRTIEVVVTPTRGRPGRQYRLLVERPGSDLPAADERFRRNEGRGSVGDIREVPGDRAIR